MKAPKTLGGRLREAREEKGLTMRQVKAASGVSIGFISGLENGTLNNPCLNNILRLCSVYCTTVSEITEGLR